MIEFTGGRTDQRFFEQTKQNYLSASLTVGFIKNADKTAVGFLVGGAMAETWGVYTVGQYLMNGPAAHLGRHASTLKLVAGTTAVNTLLLTGAYEAGNVVGAIIRTSTNRALRSLE